MQHLTSGTSKDYNDSIHMAGPLNFNVSHCIESNIHYSRKILTILYKKSKTGKIDFSPSGDHEHFTEYIK